jgi:hypothetical protein
MADTRPQIIKQREDGIPKDVRIERSAYNDYEGISISNPDEGSVFIAAENIPEVLIKLKKFEGLL